MRFPYFKVGDNSFAPIVPLRVLGANGWLGMEAYIDSGATYSIFSFNRAEMLGLEYTKGERLSMTVGDGGRIIVYVHRLKVELAGDVFTAEIGFSKQLGVRFNLLGRKSFFTHFKICFDDRHRCVDVHTL